MKKVLILLLLGSFSMQLTAMGDGNDERPVKKQKTAGISAEVNENLIESKEEAEQPLNTLDQQLCDAVMNDDIESVKDALTKGANPNMILDHPDIGDNTPLLIMAVNKQKLDIIKILVSHPKINIYASNDYGNTALHETALIFSPKIADFLIKAGANANQINNDGDTPLMHIFFDFGGYDFPEDFMTYLKITKLFADAGDVNIQNKKGNTALMMVIDEELCDSDTFENSDVIPYLVKKCNASVTIKNNKGKTALDIARKFNNQEVIELLENKLKEVKDLQQKIKQEICEATPLLKELGGLISEYLEGSKPIQTV